MEKKTLCPHAYQTRWAENPLSVGVVYLSSSFRIQHLAMTYLVILVDMTQLCQVIHLCVLAAIIISVELIQMTKIHQMSHTKNSDPDFILGISSR